MSFVSCSTPRWVAVPVIFVSGFVVISGGLAVLYFILGRGLGVEDAMKTWILTATVFSIWFTTVVLRDHSFQAAEARLAIPVNGMCERFGSFVYLPLSDWWSAPGVTTSLGSLAVEGNGKSPQLEQIVLWNRMTSILPELLETAFVSLFLPDPAHFRQAGFGLAVSKIVFSETDGKFTVVFTASGFPSHFSLGPTVVFNSELKPIEADWNLYG